MPETRRSTSDDHALALRLVALLNDDQVLEKLKSALYPNALAAQIKSLVNQMESLRAWVKSQSLELESRIDDLEKV